MAEAQGLDVGPEMTEDLAAMPLEELKRIHKEMEAEEERAQLIAAIARSRRMRSEGTLTRRSLLNREENERLTALHCNHARNRYISGGNINCGQPTATHVPTSAILGKANVDHQQYT
jgi:hypothetical protein